MKPRVKFALALVASALLVAGACAALLFLLWSALGPAEQALFVSGLVASSGLLVFLSALLITALGLVLHGVFRSYVMQPQRLAEETWLILTANPAHRIACAGPAEIEQLSAAINALAARREALQRDVDSRIAEARSDLEQEKNRLAALMSELSESVIVCNTAGLILLYNQRARQLLGAAAEKNAAHDSPDLIGLGRSLFAVMDHNVVSHALDYITLHFERGNHQPVSEFVTTTRGGQLIQARMAPVVTAAAESAGTPEISGFVLVLEDIRRELEIGSLRDRVLTSLTEGTRSSLANIQAAIENLVGYPKMNMSERQRFLQIIADETGKLGTQLNSTATIYTDHLRSEWPLATMLGRDLLSTLKRSIEEKFALPTALGGSEQPIWLKVDSFLLVQAFTYLAGRLRDEGGVRTLELRLQQAGLRPQLDMAWRDATLAVETALAWQNEPIKVSGHQHALTFKSIVERHGGEAWYQLDSTSQTAYFRVILPLAEQDRAAGSGARAPSRPTSYDFDLFHQPGQSTELDQRLLTDLAYTVFDTETTGLEPSAGDEIIALGAVRIVNGRLLSHEVFDQLADTQRKLSAASVRVHGITRDLLQGQPNIEQVLRAFHRFCEDTVLVAHNAAFDMRFLQIKEAAAGVRFAHPVLDTLMLSAVVHPTQTDHTLEAIAARLGIKVIGRHTALGDASVTGEIFLKMLPLLRDKGILTLKQTREAAQQTPYARVQY